MVWKLFLLVLFWEITGAAVYWGYITKFMMKLQKLDPKNDELIYEMLEMISFGILDAKKHDGESEDNRDKRIYDQCESFTGEPLLLTHLKAYFMWPKQMALVVPYTQQAYETLKSEYDQGIRTRKEGPVSQ